MAWIFDYRDCRVPAGFRHLFNQWYELVLIHHPAPLTRYRMMLLHVMFRRRMGWMVFSEEVNTPGGTPPGTPDIHE